MADILIRGMEMPKENEILVFDMWHGKIYARSTANIGAKFYEVVPLPEGHGRLGDLTEIEKKLQKTLDEMGDRWLSSPSMMAQRVAIVADLKKVKESHTIIPAEGGTDCGT